MPGSDASTLSLPDTLLLAGCGKMGGALLAGWLRMGLEGRRVTVVDPGIDEATSAPLRAQGVTINPPPGHGSPPAVLVLAIKPQTLDTAAPDLARLVGPETLLVSIVAGKTVSDLARAFPGVRAFARAMPNTPAAVGCGITGVVADPGVTEAQRRTVDTLLRSVGAVEWLDDEALIDAVTAVSGSGPAYVFYLTECLAKAGEAAGLPPETAQRLARATIEGAGALMAADPAVPPATLRRNVTSPGGTTAAAVAVLESSDRLAGLMLETVLAARDRARALAG